MATATTSTASPNAATVAQGAGKAPSSAGEKVVVANKLPMGLRIRNFDMKVIKEQQRDGSTRDVDVAEARPDTFLINGTATPRGAGRGAIMPAYRIYRGYAFTEGVDKASFDAWYKDNKDQNFVKNMLVFSASSVSDAEAIARENEKRVTNMEPLNPDGDPRSIRGVATADRAN